jgi:hypothetical protein
MLRRRSSVHVMMCNKSLLLMHGLDKYNIHTIFQNKLSVIISFYYNNIMLQIIIN